MTPEIAPFVSALSVMLAAYGFFYNTYKSEIEKGHDVGAAAANRIAWDKQATTVKRARAAARVLAGVPLVVFLVFLPKLIEKIQAAVEVPSLDRYSTLDVVFALLVLAWLAITVVLGLQSQRLTAKLETLEKSKPAG